MKKRVYLVFLIALIAASMFFLVSAGGQSNAPAVHDYANPGELLTLVEKQVQPYILVDVRTADEYAGGHIPTAENIPFDIIADNLPTENREDLIVVYCRSGRRSAVAAETLRNLGFSAVVDFGAVTNWPGELVH